MTEIYDAHAELHHYTNLSGVRGILESQLLWATHYSALNDQTEVRHLRAPLEAIVFRIVNNELRQRCNASFSFKRQVDKFGGLAAQSRKVANHIVDILYGITLEKHDEGDALAEPYILSFCAHSKDEQYFRKHGLLSQWRAYGTSGRFALVFDTKELLQIMKGEGDAFHYNHMAISDVVYDNQKEAFEEEFSDLRSSLQIFYAENLIEDRNNFETNLFTPFFGAITRFKHHAFLEEREVRMVASPVTEGLLEMAIKTGEISEKTHRKSIKEIHSHDKSGAKVQFIKLNEFSGASPLPIKRIIVGPQKNQDEQVNTILELVGKTRIPIFRSETPYIGG